MLGFREFSKAEMISQRWKPTNIHQKTKKFLLGNSYLYNTPILLTKKVVLYGLTSPILSKEMDFYTWPPHHLESRFGTIPM